jgi:hypothetical protein
MRRAASTAWNGAENIITGEIGCPLLGQQRRALARNRRIGE